MSIKVCFSSYVNTVLGMLTHRRRKMGRWTQEEVEMLISKMEAGRFWAQIRDEWPRLGFPRRSDVDLKDKWRNLEDVVLKGKPTRTVKLSEEQMARIHRCHRKYRVMQASVSPGRLQSPPQQQTGPPDQESMPQKQAAHDGAGQAADNKSNPSDSYRPTAGQTSSDGSDNAANQDAQHHAAPQKSPMTNP